MTVVEQSPGLRPGGQAVDARGVAKEVIRRMGLDAAVRAACTDTAGAYTMDADGNVLETFRGEVRRPYAHLCRDGLLGKCCYRLVRAWRPCLRPGPGVSSGPTDAHGCRIGGRPIVDLGRGGRPGRPIGSRARHQTDEKGTR